MLTGTPLDLTAFGALLSSVGLLYWAVVATAIAFAFWLPRHWLLKLACGGAVGAALLYPVATNVMAQQAAQARLQKAWAHFQMRCQSAGEKIHRTVENVDGVVWMKWRDQAANDGDQFKLDDPYGRECGGEECIKSLLRLTVGAASFPEESAARKNGYRFIETIHPQDGQARRYVGAMKLPPSWDAEAIAQHKQRTGNDPPGYSYRFYADGSPVDKLTARYGITWDDISTREDREYWIAGGALKVVDVETGEVLAERVGYMIDQGQGSRAGFRSPWLYASDTACPAKVDANGSRTQIGFTLRFANRVLKANPGD